MDPRKWDFQTWLAVIGLAISLITFLGGIAFGIWRISYWWYWNELRELRRIYRKAATLGESGFFAKLRRTYREVAGKRTPDDVRRHSLITVVKDERFWRGEVLDIAVNRAEEKARFSQLLAEQAGGELSNEYKDAVNYFYRAVHNGLAAAKSERWREQAKSWRDEIEREKLEARLVNVKEIRQRAVEVNADEDVIALEGADLAQLTAAQDELQELHKRALSHQDAELALQVAYERSVIRDLKGNREGAREVLCNALDLVLKQGKDAPLDLQIRVLARAAHLANKQADCEEAESFAEKMLDLSQEAGHDSGVAMALQHLGRSKYFRCESELARELLERSLIIFQNLRDFRGVAWVQFDLGELEVNQNDFPSAQSWLEKSLVSHQKSEEIGEGVDKNGEATIRVNLAFVLHKQGEWKAAHVHMTKAAELLKGEKKQENYFRWYLHFLGRLDIDKGDFDAARARFNQSSEIFGERKDTLGIIRSLLGFSLLAAKEGDLEKAVMLLGAEKEMRKREFDVPFPPDWEEEKRFIETGARRALNEAVFNEAWSKGMMNWEQIIRNLIA